MCSYIKTADAENTVKVGFELETTIYRFSINFAMCASAIVTSQDVRCLVGLYWSLYLYWSFSLLTHRHHASTPDVTAVQRYPFWNKFSSKATASDFQCWKSIILSWNFRVVKESAGHCCLAMADATKAQARALWKEGESGAAGVFHAFLGEACLGEAPKSVYTGRDKETVANHLNFVSVCHK